MVMKWFFALCLGVSLWLPSGLAFAGEALRQFASELMAYESKQVLRLDRPLKYSDPEGGAALRALLSPARTTLIIDEYFAGMLRSEVQPDVPKLMEPLVKRYEAAFKLDPWGYEAEHLDAQNWLVGIVEGSAKASLVHRSKVQVTPGMDVAAVNKVLDSLQSLSDSMMNLMVQEMRKRANSGVYSAAGRERVLALADRVSATIPSTPRPPPPPPSQAIQRSGGAPVAWQDIEENFSRKPLLAADAFAQMQQCDARIDRKNHDGFVASAMDARKGISLLTYAGSGAMFAVAGRYWTCVKLGPAGVPVLPVDVLRNTVTSIGASKAGLSDWRRKLLADLAMTGKATGLIEMSNGRAAVASFTLSTGQSTVLSYEVKYLNPGTYNRSDYPIVLAEPGITSVALIYAGGSQTKTGVALFSSLTREPLTADGYVAIAGSDLTATTNFTGGVWKLDSVSEQVNTLRLEPQGVAIWQTPQSSQPGQWKVTGKVLQLEVNSGARYALALSEDGRFLEGDLARKELPRPNIQGMPARPQHDDADGDLRFPSQRFYRETDTDYDKVVLVKRENAKLASAQAVRNLFSQAELRRAQILRETPEQEAAEQAKSTGASQLWRVCDTAAHSQLIFASMPTPAPLFAGRTVGEVCYSWAGTRQNWKATILQEGCRGRCQHF
jgi:hypothetical protein